MTRGIFEKAYTNKDREIGRGRNSEFLKAGKQTNEWY